jgi:hypothetical protein
MTPIKSWIQKKKTMMKERNGRNDPQNRGCKICCGKRIGQRRLVRRKEKRNRLQRTGQER